MASTPSSKSPSRATPPRPAKTTALEDPGDAPLPPVTRLSKANTFPNDPPPRAGKPAAKASGAPEAPDVFENVDSDEVFEPPRASVDLDDLPIELVSLTDSFIDSLSAKVHSAPPNIDALARRFQDFYDLAANHIQTHTNSLATRQARESSPAPTTSARTSAAGLLRAKATSLGSKEKPKPTPTKGSSGQQMLTAEELAGRKKARKALEQKRGLLEEAVERRLCEGIYDRIYRHRTTQDEAQDDKLRSKTAALAVVGIGPSDLGVDLGDPAPALDLDAAIARQNEVREWLQEARRELILMNQSRYPLGKLNRLKAAHKSIIDTLSHFHPSSSADELMPMLIYTLITLPPEHLNIISDLHFIQRFRWEQKLVGEAAYCLTNLEATISFLETVDLSTLRADEPPSGPSKSATPSSETSKAETFPPAYAPGPSPPSQSAPETTPGTATGTLQSTPSSASLRPAVPLRNRRLSDLVNTPAQALGAASDAVFNTADQGLKNIGNSLGDSYKFLIGKLREAPMGLTGSGGEVVVPKTLDDARKLIGTPPPDDADGGSPNLGDPAAAAPPRTAPLEDKMLNLIGGSRKGTGTRDHSADSSRSASSSSKKVAFAADGPAGQQQQQQASAASSFHSAASSAAVPPSGSNNPPLIDSMRNLGSSFNPMARLTGIGGFRGFGRNPPPASPASSARDANKGAPEGGDLATAFPDIAGALPPKEIAKINPPVKRFMEMQNPADLKISEVLELLKDYRRLAGVLRDMDAFKE